MKKVSARNFQLNAAKYLKELPIILTRNNIPVATVLPFRENSPSVDNFKIEGAQELREVIRPDRPFAPEPVDPTKPLDYSKSKYPTSFMGKPLSGRREKCPVCNEENIPVEFATKHYTDNHGDI